MGREGGGGVEGVGGGGGGGETSRNLVTSRKPGKHARERAKAGCGWCCCSYC